MGRCKRYSACALRIERSPMKQKLSPEMNRKAWLCAALIVLMMLLLGVGAYEIIKRRR